MTDTVRLFTGQLPSRPTPSEHTVRSERCPASLAVSERAAGLEKRGCWTREEHGSHATAHRCQSVTSASGKAVSICRNRRVNITSPAGHQDARVQ